MAHEAEAAPRLEPPGVSVRPVVWAAFASIALVLGAVWGLQAVHNWRVADRTLPTPERFPSPRVQTHQAEQRQDLLAAQRRQLAGYAWADEGKTLVRIPIERAMDIIAQRGAGAYAPLLPPGKAPAAPPAGAAPATSGQGTPHESAPPRGEGSGVGVGAGQQPAHRRQPRWRKH